MTVAAAATMLVGLTANKAEAIPRGTCVPCTSPITEDNFADRYQVYADINCSAARNVTFRFLMRYYNIAGQHTAYDERRSWPYLNRAYIHGIRQISVHTVRYVYAEATVCFGSSPRRCKSDVSYAGRA